MTGHLSDPAVFRADELTVRYGGVIANDQVSVEVQPGEIVGLIGPNGAGKTTFVDAVSGFTDSTGTVTLGTRRLDGLPPHRRRRAGLARTWQAGELFPDLTVAQNLAVALEPVGLRTIAADLFRRAQSNATVADTLRLLGLADAADRRPHELSLGQQKMVGVGRALSGGSGIVLLDEPAAGLDTQESAAFGSELTRIADSGVGLLLIDHDMGLVLSACDRIYVMDFGRVIASGPPDAIRADRSVIAAYLGDPVEP